MLRYKYVPKQAEEKKSGQTVPDFQEFQRGQQETMEHVGGIFENSMYAQRGSGDRMVIGNSDGLCASQNGNSKNFRQNYNIKVFNGIPGDNRTTPLESEITSRSGAGVFKVDPNVPKFNHNTPIRSISAVGKTSSTVLNGHIATQSTKAGVGKVIQKFGNGLRKLGYGRSASSVTSPTLVVEPSTPLISSPPETPVSLSPPPRIVVSPPVENNIRQRTWSTDGEDSTEHTGKYRR
ncbi:hypothetical protein SNE40_007388 [Patella caerulea]|uniref:Uncharacterized protein n=1 Tax=Patella caerulea TaxID=87958 RepID=A0AAN8PUX5_PATCE